MKYEVKCSHCNNQQIYKPKKKLTKDSHTKCSSCRKDFYVKVDAVEEIINAKTTQDNKLKGNKPFDKLTEDVLEGLIVQVLNKDRSSSNIRMAVDFYVKCKTTDQEGTDTLDMEEFISAAKE